MVDETKSLKEHYIELFKKNGFNCFPIKHNEKVADTRYNAAETKSDQEITSDENYGIIPTIDGHNCIIDFDNKESFRKYLERMIDDGWMVIETPHGWHLPIIGLSDHGTKMELFNPKIQTKKIIEIQGFKQYCVGAESVVFDKDTEKYVTYINKGKDKIYNVKGISFNALVDSICKLCKVSSKKSSTSTNYNLRARFKKGEPPTAGTSNNYFHEAARECLKDNMNYDDAIARVQIVYDNWKKIDTFSGRPFSNVEAKFREVYDSPDLWRVKVGRKESDDNLNPTEIAEQLLRDNKLYSDIETDELFENQNGFLEKINNKLHSDLQEMYHAMKKTEFDDIKFKLIGLAESIPPTNKKLIVFANGVYDVNKKQLVKTDEIADMGFKDYNYLEKIKENEPKKFIATMFDNIKDNEYPRVKAALKACISNYLDSRITVTHGMSGVGKSTGLVILVGILNKREDYALTVELGQILEDKFIKAKIRGKRLVVLQDLPKSYKDFSAIKAMTGEMMKTERGFHQDSVTFENKIKLWGTGNYLAKIPENEKNAMYSRRLSLIHNKRETPYPENPEFVEEVIKEEGEKIISWILNIPDSECGYESPITVKNEWEGLASPEFDFIDSHYEIDIDEQEKPIPVIRICKRFEELYQVPMPIKEMSTALTALGYSLRNNLIQNIKEKAIAERQKGQQMI